MIKVTLLKDIAVLTVDTSGRGLSQRGYRVSDVAFIEGNSGGRSGSAVLLAGRKACGSLLRINRHRGGDDRAKFSSGPRKGICFRRLGADSDQLWKEERKRPTVQ